MKSAIELLGVFFGLCFAGALITRTVFMISPVPLPTEASEQIQYIREQVGYTNVKLQRVEKKLGSDPRQKPQHK